jgi:cellulose synthase/poly-beta-1,6-N-acetylglucosamine synthase-like glycosyltransferase
MYINFRGFGRIVAAVVTLPLLIIAVLGLVPSHYGPFVALLTTITAYIQVTLGLYGLNSFFLLYRTLVAGESRGEAQRSLRRWGNQEWPRVTVQLPIFNERYVVKRLLETVSELDYPADKLEIQVLDDSTDGTSEIVRECVEQLKQTTQVKIVHITRKSRTHFKAGALVLGTAQAKGEFLAIFDADFLPQRDFLKLTIPRFQDEKIGCVQCRWGHLNFDHSLLTKLQAIGHDGHFMIEQYAKSKSGFTLNFNGTAGVWRRQCIVEAGDWSGDTLAEDLDLSYRAQLKGWRIDYVRDIVVPAELPLSITAFKKQQARWAKGSMQTFLKLLPQVWDSTKLSNVQKVQATVHLYGYGVHPLMLLNLLVTCCLFLLTPTREPDVLLVITAVIALGPPLVVMVSQLLLGLPGNVKLLPSLILLHHGLCLSNTSAVFEAFQGMQGTFERTPKFGDASSMNQWAGTNYARALKAVGFPMGETLMALLLLGLMVAGFKIEVNYAVYPWLIFFFLGFCEVIAFHISEMLMLRRSVPIVAKEDANGASKTD